MKKAVLKVETALLNAFWRALYPLNLFLFLVFLVLSGTYLSMNFVEKIPLPQFFTDLVKHQAESHGLIVDFEKVQIKLDEKLSLHNLSLRFPGTAESFFKAENVSLSFSWSDLIKGKLKIFGVEILGAKMSPTYGNIQTSPAIYDMHLRLSHMGKWWNLESLNFRSGQLAVSSSGVVSEDVKMEDFLESAFAREVLSAGSLMAAPFASKKDGENMEASKETAKEKKEEENLSPASKLDMVFAKLSEIKKHIDKFSDPVLDLKFKIFGEDSEFACAFNSGGKIFPLSFEGEDVEIQTRGLRIFAALSSGRESYSGRWSAFAEEVKVPKYIDASRISVRSKISPGGGNVSLEEFEISFYKISGLGVKLANVSLLNEYLNPENYLEGWEFYADFGGEVFSASVDFDKDWNSKIKLNGNLRPEVFISLPALNDIEELKECSFPNGIFLSAEADLNLKSLKCNLVGSLEAGECVVYRMPVKSVFADFEFDSEKNFFLASNVIAESSEGWKINGSFGQDFTNMRYRINLRGNLRPMAIAHFMEEWWTDILGAVELGDGNFVFADASVEGAWGKPEYIWAFVGAEGKNASYKGSKFDEFSLKIWVNPSRISIYDVELRREGRTANAVLEWLYGSEGITSYERQTIFLESNLNSKELISLGGKDAEDVLEVVKFSNEPRVSLNALLYNPNNNPEGRKDAFNAHVFAAGKTRVADFATLENLRCFARSDSIRTQIEDASFRFCDGNGKGILFLEKLGDKMSFDAEMDLKGMDQDDFEAFLRGLGSSGNSLKSASEISEKKDSESGEGDGSVVVQGVLKGITDDPKSFKGGGFVAVENSRLIRFSVLGIMSRALESLNLPSGSFTLTYMHSPFEVEGGSIRFPKLETGGNIAKINGAASYDFISDDLNALLFVQPLGGVSAPIISGVFSLINPLSNVVEVKMTGPVDNPKTSVSINPVNVLRSDRRIIDGIRNSFDDDGGE